MSYGMLEEKQLEAIDASIQENLIRSGVKYVILIDMAGNTIVKQDDGKCDLDSLAFSALAAGNFAAVDAMAKLVGESEFSLLFHKGEKASIHFSRVSNEYLLITMFGKDLSLGLLRLKVADTIAAIQTICD